MGARMIITIDGPAGTGKSSVAHQLAQRLGLEFLDTGAMYRAAALLAIEEDIDPERGELLAEAVRTAGMRFDWTQDPPRLMLNDRDVTRRLRDFDVSEVVSIVARQPELRRVLVQSQREIANRHPRLVTEGRDQGSVVFPDAQVRFYLDADARVRARRRAAQLKEQGQTVDVERIVRDIEQRDRLDSTRPDAPLTTPSGAEIVDTSELSFEEVVDRLERVVREQCTEELLACGCGGGHAS